MPARILFTVVTFNSLVLFLPIAMLVLWRKPQLWLHLLTFFLGVITGFIGYGTDDPQFPVLLLLVFGFFAGFAQPKRAWLWALLLAVWVPLFELAAVAVGASKGQLSSALESFIVFLPAFLGAYGGVLVNRAAHSKIENRAIEG